MIWFILLLAVSTVTNGLQTDFTKGQGKVLTKQHIDELLQEDTAAFTVNFSKQLLKSTPAAKNILFSPLNLYIALALVHLAAYGDTKHEIADVMGLPNYDNATRKIHSHLSSLVSKIQNTDNAVVQMGAGVFVQKEFTVKDTYVNAVSTYHKSETVNVDFVKESNKALKTVNEWISKKTKGRIENLFKQPFPSNTVLLLASTLYFNASWAYPFPHYQTQPGTFKSGTTEVQVQLMSNQKSIPYLNDPDSKYEMIGVPYDEQEFAMYILLPYENQTVEHVATGFNEKTLHESVFLARKNEQEVHYKIPRMKFSWEKDLVEHLQALGIKKLFGTPDLRNLTSVPNVRVTKVTHAAETEITETGTVATATAIEAFENGTAVIVQPKPIQFFVKRPFVFFIYHHDTRMILFHGVVYKPE